MDREWIVALVICVGTADATLIFFAGDTHYVRLLGLLRRRRLRKSSSYRGLVSPSKKFMAWTSSNAFHGGLLLKI
jgi:hypothetical protein